MRRGILLIALLTSVRSHRFAELGPIDEEVLDRFVEMAHRRNVPSTIPAPSKVPTERLTTRVPIRDRPSPLPTTKPDLQPFTEQPIKFTPKPKKNGSKGRPTTAATSRPQARHLGIQLPIDPLTVPGRPDIDYPTYSHVPLTRFYCYNQRRPGYYADPEARCQVYHVCDTDGRQDSFLCPSGTLFNQLYFVCDWWFNVDCREATQFYALNGLLHRSPKVQAPTGRRPTPRS